MFRNYSVLQAKMKAAVSLKLQRLVLDPKYQTRKVILRNIHTASCVMALKFAGICHFLHIAKVNVNKKFMINCIMLAVRSIAQHCVGKGETAEFL